MSALSLNIRLVPALCFLFGFRENILSPHTSQFLTLISDSSVSALVALIQLISVL